MSKGSITITNPKRLVVSIFVLVAIIVVIVLSFKACNSGDPIEKEISKIEGQQVTVVSRIIKPSIDSGDLQVGSYINFVVEYAYSLSDSTIKDYTVEEKIKVEVSDENIATVQDENGVQVNPEIEAGKKLTVNVEYRNLEDSFEYTLVDAN